MYCKNCGKEIDDHAYVCLNCGARVKAESEMVQRKTNGMAIAGFVCSLLSIPFLVTMILGVVFGVCGLKRSEELGGTGKVMSIAAICISAAWIVFIVLGLIL